MNKKTQLSVRERVEAALKIARCENPHSRISVSELSRLAGVSRANLYSSHRDIVASLKPGSGKGQLSRRSADLSEKLKQIRMELRDEVRKNRALVYLLIELRAELQRTRNQLVEEKQATGAREKRR
ncbi:MAG TPA: hypothetical protein VJQ54_22565 [Candidatus Sulfotelmatobacter sp.]|nr:hypothetical protein [Candidatus Sulfotelmatobacter sp.]